MFSHPLPLEVQLMCSYSHLVSSHTESFSMYSIIFKRSYHLLDIICNIWKTNLDVHQRAQWKLKGPVLVSVQIRQFLLEENVVGRSRALPAYLWDHLDWRLWVKFRIQHVTSIKTKYPQNWKWAPSWWCCGQPSEDKVSYIL